MTRTLFILDDFADTLLALGISAAYGVTPEFLGSAYVFPDHAAVPIRFPEMAQEDETPQPPTTYSRFHWYALTALKGAKNTQWLQQDWNQTLPEYAELWPLLEGADPRQSRFWDVPKRASTAAAFRPHQPKSVDAGGTTTVHEFWLFDALRAIGWLSYAITIYLPDESATCRYLITVPTVPVQITGMTGVNSRLAALCMLYFVAAENGVRMLRIAQYAEMNRFSRSAFGQYGLTIPDGLPAVQTDLWRHVVYAIDRYLPPSVATEHYKCLLQVLDTNQDVTSRTLAMAQFVQRWTWAIAKSALPIAPVTTTMVAGLLTLL